MTNQTTSHHADCTCPECSLGLRNRFFPGKTMKSGEFQTEQSYHIQRRRMLTRASAGWGIVSGLVAKKDGPWGPGPIEVSAGLALDRHGREAVLAKEARIGPDNTFVIQSGAGSCQLTSIEDLPTGDYVLSIHYAERYLGDVRLPDDCSCPKHEKNFVCETVVFSLTPLGDKPCPCGQPKCPNPCKCKGHGCAECESARGPQSCLCDWTGDRRIPKPGELKCTWQGFHVDAEDGVALACVRFDHYGCDPLVGELVDDCSPRRLVKNNDLLYDLIRGCDLTRIKWISWGHWHRADHPVPWEEFIKCLNPQPAHHDVRTGLEVEFSGPVLRKTIRTDCFSIRFTVPHTGTCHSGKGWYESRELLVTRVIPVWSDPDDPPGTVRKVALCIDHGWYHELIEKHHKPHDKMALVQIEVNGDFILDCHGQSVDANARGFALRIEPHKPVEPSGNGTPGGVLISVFRLKGVPEHDHDHGGDEGNRWDPLTEQEEYQNE